jgi:hypothetical protein
MITEIGGKIWKEGAKAGLGVVVIVSVVVAEPAPGVTAGGLNTQLVSAGRPAHASVTEFEYAPPTADTVTV